MVYHEAPAVPGRIVATSLSKSFGSIRAVDQLNFSVEPGSITGFLGPNGAGKTTTLRMILGLVRPTSGYATIGGLRYSQLRDPLRIVGSALEASSFHPARTARNHIRVYCAAAGLPGRRADEVLDMVGLSSAAKRKAKGFSLGMRQRLSLATALLGDPRVLILDEPANGLDPEGIRWLRGFLRHLAGQGRTVLVSSHLLSEVQQTVDRVVILAHGRCVQQGSLEELAAGQGSTIVVRSPQIDQLAGALSQTQAQISRSGPEELRILGLEAPEVGHHAFVANCEIHELRTERVDLENVFFQLTRSSSGGAGDGQVGSLLQGRHTAGHVPSGPQTAYPPAGYSAGAYPGPVPPSAPFEGGHR